MRYTAIINQEFKSARRSSTEANNLPSLINCSFVVRPAARSDSNLSASRNAASVEGRHRTSVVRRCASNGLFAVFALTIQLSPFQPCVGIIPHFLRPRKGENDTTLVGWSLPKIPDLSRPFRKGRVAIGLSGAPIALSIGRPNPSFCDLPRTVGFVREARVRQDELPGRGRRTERLSAVIFLGRLPPAPETWTALRTQTGLRPSAATFRIFPLGQMSS